MRFIPMPCPLLPRLLPSLLLLALPSMLYAQRAPNIARSLTSAVGAQGRLMWIDGTANLFRKVTKNGKQVEEPWTTSLSGVRDIVQKCKRAHVNTLIVDVKPLSGEVLYASKIAPRLRVWKGKPVPDFDVLAAFVEEIGRASCRERVCSTV